MSSRTLRRVYAVLALGALVATWSQNIRFFAQDDSGGLSGFISGAYDNAAAASLSNDLLVIALVAYVFMVVEARRLGIRRVWLYIAGSFLNAVSVMFPLFLIARERRVEAHAPAAAG
jgi:hypothetical protein